MILAAKTLAANAYDLFTSPELVAEAKAEHKRRLEGKEYKPMLEKDQPPPLNYRKVVIPGGKSGE